MDRHQSIGDAYDVAVIGGGAGGMTAALTSANAGASVLLIEASNALGGALALSGGSFLAAGTPMQKQAGYEDSADRLFDYFVTFSQWRVEPALVRTYCDQAAAGLDWLMSLGADYPSENLYRDGLEPAPRTHRPTGGGHAVAEVLARACRRSGVDLALSNRVEGLDTDDGAVVGVRARGEVLRARSVVLTSGTFAHDRQMVERFYPDAARCTTAGNYWSVFPETCVGDGLTMAMDLGAATAGLNCGSLQLSTNLIKELEPFRPGWLVFVNAEGRRYINEQAPYSVQDKAVWAQGGYAWVIFDDASKCAAAGPSDQRFGSGFWTAQTIDTFTASGDVLRRGSIEELAGAMEVPAAALAATVRRYNADCKGGEDTEYFKPAADLRPILTPPFYAVKIYPAIIGVTGFGVRIDPQARVLSTANEPIPGLFAAGDVTGNVMGSQYIAGGLSIGKAVVFGRIAGANAVRAGASG
jgi:flavocytochrome c